MDDEHDGQILVTLSFFKKSDKDRYPKILQKEKIENVYQYFKKFLIFSSGQILWDLGKGKIITPWCTEGGEDHEHLQNLGHKHDQKCTNT